MYLVGRESEERFLRNFLKSNHKLLQVYGQPSVGKTSLVVEILNEMNTDFSQICYKIIQDDWPKEEFYCFDEKNKTLLVADNFQNVFEKNAMADFNHFYEKLLVSQHIKVIIIFNGPSEIMHVQSITLHLRPLEDFDSVHLFQQSLPENLSSSEDLVHLCSKFCDNIPGRIMSLCNKLSQCPVATSPRDVLDFLQNSQDVDTFLPNKFTESFKQYLRQLSIEHQEAISKLSYFPGKFSLHDMMALTNYKGEQQVKFNLVYPLMNQGLIKSADNSSMEFVLPSVVHQYCRNHITHIFHADCTKLKFNRIIGEALIKAEKIKDKGLIYNVIGIFEHKWESIAQLIAEAIHSPSDGENFEIYCKVAVEARSIISLCFPNAATEFFKAILDASKKLGTEKEKALLMVSYGQSLFENTGNFTVKEAQWHFKSALKTLQEHGCDYQCLLTCNYMSLNYYKQGKLKKGIRSAEKAIETVVFDRDIADVEHAKTYSYSYLAHNLIFAGDHSRADEVLHRRLSQVGESGHPAVSHMLNNLGLNIERSGGLPSLALQYYLSSLFTKRSISSVQEHILVPTLCNVAGQFSKNELKHDLALHFLHEAEDIRKRNGWVHPYTALVMWNIGMVTMRKGCYEGALPFLCKADSLYDQVNPNHYANAEVKIWLAHCVHLLGDKSRVEKLLSEALASKDKYLLLRPQSESVCCILEHYVRLSADNRQKCEEYLREVTSELKRLYHCPSVPREKQKSYKEFYDWYVRIENNLKENVPFHHNLLNLPFTCLPCREIIKFNMYHKEIYAKSLCNITSHNVSTEHSILHGLSPYSSEVRTVRSHCSTTSMNDFRYIASYTKDQHEKNIPNFDLLLTSVSLSEDGKENAYHSSNTIIQKSDSSSLQEADRLKQIPISPNVPLLENVKYDSFSKRQTKGVEKDMKTEKELSIPKRGNLVNPPDFNTRESLCTNKSSLLPKNIEENEHDTTAQVDTLIEDWKSLRKDVDRYKNVIKQHNNKPAFNSQATKHLDLQTTPMKQPDNLNLIPPAYKIHNRDHNLSVTRHDNTPSVGIGALKKREPILPPDETFTSNFSRDSPLSGYSCIGSVYPFSQNCRDSPPSGYSCTGSVYSFPQNSSCFDDLWQLESRERHKTQLAIDQENTKIQVLNSLSSSTTFQHHGQLQTDSRHPEQLQIDKRLSGQLQIDERLSGQFQIDRRHPEQLQIDERLSRQFQTDRRHPEQVQIDERLSGQFQTDSRHPEQLQIDERLPGQFQTDRRHHEQFQIDRRHPEQLQIDERLSRQFQTDRRHPEQVQIDERLSGQFQTDSRHLEQLQTDRRHPEPLQIDERLPGQFQTDRRHHEQFQIDRRHPEQLQIDERLSRQFQTDRRHPEQVQIDERLSGQFQTDSRHPEQLQTDRRHPEQLQIDERLSGQFQTDSRHPEQLQTDRRHPEQLQIDERLSRQFQTDRRHPEQLQIDERLSRQFQTDRRHPEQLQIDERLSRQFQTDRRHPEQLQTDRRHPEQLQIDERLPGQFQTDRRHHEQFQIDRRHPEQLVTNRRHPEQLQIDERLSGQLQTDRRHPEQVQTDRRHPEQLVTNRRHPEQLQTDRRHPEQLQIDARLSGQFQTVRRQPIEHEDRITE